MTQLLDDLRALDALFSDESKWTQGYLARDANGIAVEFLHSDAVCWCLGGAAMKVSEGATHRYGRICEALHDATPRSAYNNFVIWNDRASRKFHQVKSLIARAIATEEGRVT